MLDISQCLVNCDCFYQSKHLFVHEATSPRINPVVLSFSGKMAEWVEEGGASVWISCSLDSYIMDKK